MQKFWIGFWNNSVKSCCTKSHLCIFTVFLSYLSLFSLYVIGKSLDNLWVVCRSHLLFFQNIKIMIRISISPSYIYSWSIGHILEHELFCLGHFGCAGSEGKKSGFEFFWATFESVFFQLFVGKFFFWFY